MINLFNYVFILLFFILLSMNNNDRFNSIILDEVILTIFIFLNVLNFYADELEKKCLFDNDNNRLKLSKKIIIVTLTVTLFIYIYFLYANYKDMIKNQYSKDSYIFETRFIGSVLIVIGLGCFLYFRIVTRNNFNDYMIEN